MKPTSFLEILTTDSPQILVAMIFAVTTLVLVAISSLLKAVIGARQTPIMSEDVRVTNFKELVSTPAISAAIQKSSNPEEVIFRLLGDLEVSKPQFQPKVQNMFVKMLSDITWDVAGLIGTLVTIALLIMMIARQVDGIPKEVFAGWTTILGFYFGKAVSAAGGAGQPAAGTRTGAEAHPQPTTGPLGGGTPSTSA